jgi:hypothetical protein
MTIKRFVAEKDTIITDAYKENLRTRAYDANMGEADSLEVFSLYGQVTTSSLERSRTLVQFPVDEISAARSSGSLPASGSVEFYLRLFNVKHPFSVPRKFYMTVSPTTQEWEEGYGLDLEGYLDDGFVSGSGGYGATWLYASSGTLWSSPGGGWQTGGSYEKDYYFETGLEDMVLNVTDIVEEWLSGTLDNYGFNVRMSSSFEDGSQLTSFYTKRFSARGSEYYMNRPCIEARWNPSVVDDRNNFYSSSSLLSAADNTMCLYFYNKVGGALKNIVGNPIPAIQFYTDSGLTSAVTASYSLVTNPFPGVYKAQVAVETTASVLYDKWVNELTTSIKYFSGSFDVYQRENDYTDSETEYICNITNLKPTYTQEENARMKIFVREKDWQPTVYTVAYNNVENTSIPNLYYKIFRLNDNYVIVDYSTGSLAYSKTSYDANGNYFDIDMNIFEKDYGYGIKLATWDGTHIKEFKNIFKFRVD